MALPILRISIRRDIAAAALALPVFLPGLAFAVPYDSGPMLFSSSQQSIWGSGSAPGFDASYFLGTEWNSNTLQLGGIAGQKNEVVVPGLPPIKIPCVDINPFPGVTCLPGTGITTPGTSPVTVDTRFGAKVTAQTSGKVGFNLSAKADSGSVDTNLIYTAELDLPSNPVQAGQFFNLNSQSTLAGSSGFAANFPEISGKVEAVMGAKAVFGGQICVTFAGCAPDSGLSTATVGFDPKTLEILSFNDSDSPGQIKVFDLADPALFQFGSPIEVPPNSPGLNFGNITVHVPDINTSGAVAGDVLTGSGEGDFLELKADIDGIILNAFGLPAVLGASLDAGIFSVGYDLIDLEYGPTIKIVQDFELDPTLMVELVFDQFVQVAGLAGPVMSLIAPWDQLPDIALIDAADLVTVTPHFFIDAMFSNASALGVDGEFILKVLAATFSLTGLGLTIDVGELGPLYEFSKVNNLFNLPPLFDQEFALLGFNDIVGASFVLQALSIADVPEPGTVALLLAALVGAATLSSYRRRQSVRCR